MVCSLERWDEVWRRNQLVLTELLKMDPSARLLFVEPAIDVPYDLLVRRRKPPASALRRIDERIWTYRPRKYIPRLVSHEASELSRGRGVRRVVDELGFVDPLLWVNDSSYADLTLDVDWPVLYDVTDDWLHSHLSARALRRAKREDAVLLGRAEEVVVVSQSLVATRGAHRMVRHIPDGVDAVHFTKPQPRPADLPTSKVMVYVGTLHEDRIDVDLVERLAIESAPAKVVFVGPDSLSARSHERLRRAGCVLLGSRPYEEVPAYYQHADLVIIPHAVTPFTESLDPIKGYECLIVGTPTLSTAVAGIRDLGPPIEIADGKKFVARAEELLADPPVRHPTGAATWRKRADQFVETIVAARSR